MKTPDFTTTLPVNHAPGKTFNAINNVMGWWSEDMTGSTVKLHDTFTVRFREVYITS